MQSVDANFIICLEGRWQMALLGGRFATTRFSEPGRGSHMKGRLHRRCKPAGDDEGCDEVRPVA